MTPHTLATHLHTGCVSCINYRCHFKRWPAKIAIILAGQSGPGVCVCMRVCVCASRCQLTPGCLLWRLVLFSEVVLSNGLSVHLSLLIRITGGCNDCSCVCLTCVGPGTWMCVRARTEIQDKAVVLSLLQLIDSTPVHFVTSLQSVCVGYFLSAASCVFMNAALVDICCL